MKRVGGSPVGFVALGILAKVVVEGHVFLEDAHQVLDGSCGWNRCAFGVRSRAGAPFLQPRYLQPATHLSLLSNSIVNPLSGTWPGISTNLRNSRFNGRVVSHNVPHLMRQHSGHFVFTAGHGHNLARDVNVPTGNAEGFRSWHVDQFHPELDLVWRQSRAAMIRG
jgi:hypothetical protein